MRSTVERMLDEYYDERFEIEEDNEYPTMAARMQAARELTIETAEKLEELAYAGE